MTDLVPHTGTGVAPTDTDSWVQVAADVYELADRIANTEFVPRGLRGKPPAVAAAMLYGRETGLPPMTALSQTHVIDGTPSISAEAMRALVFAAGHEIAVRESTSAKCRLAGRRRGSDEWTNVTWTMDDARRAQLLKRGSGWEKYPRAMLKARATAELCRDLFPDVIHGFRAYEEVADEPTGAVVADAEAPANTVQRKSRKRTEPPEAVDTPGRDPGEVPPSQAPVARSRPETTPPMGDRPPIAHPAAGPVHDTDLPEVIDLPPEDVHDLAPAEAPEAPPEPPEATEEAERRSPGDEGQPILRAMLRGLLARFTEVGVTDRDERLRVTSVLVGRPIATANDLTRGEASGLWDTLNLCKSREDVDRVVATTTAYAMRRAQAEAEEAEDPLERDQLTFDELAEEAAQWPG